MCICIYNFTSCVYVEESVNDEQFCCKEVSKKSEVNNFFVCSRARRAAKEAKEAPAQPAPAKVKVEVKKFVKIGRPGYKGKLVE